MKIFCFLLFTLFNQWVVAQTGYHVTYQRSRTDIQDSFKIELVFNDKAAYLYHTTNGISQNYSQGDTVFGGRKAYHHNTYFNPLKNELCYVWRYRNAKKFRYVYRKPKYLQFTIQKDNIMIAGMNCMKGYAIKKSGDTVYAVISKEIKYPYGPFCFNGLPGLVVELYDAEYKYYATMVGIIKGTFKVELPEWGIKSEKF